uniref:Leucine-rich repeat-containing N-terminal plant-type domain-containing protein n=1 Tax=Tetradesmus obliquus TaxID=3088 RepID=A0A383V4J4_TETOB|eukprot:jgi/Sobl393_1/17058/SZX60528.1
MLALLSVVLLAGAAAAAAPQGTAAEAGLPAIPSLDQPQQELEVSAYPLSQLPGCNYTGGDNFELPVGLLEGDCAVVMDAVAPGDPQVFTFSVPPGGASSLVLGLAVQGGTASMSLWLPGMSVADPPAAVQNELFSSPASSEGWISVPPSQLEAAPSPGKFLLSVTAFSGSPRVTLTVTTPGKDLQLVEREVALLRGVTEACCTGAETAEDSPFCAVIAPQSLSNNHPWVVDPCHLAPSSCNAEGRLVRLALPVMGLACKEFPAQLGALTALRRLDLTGNNLEGVDMADVAKVVSGLPDLQELALGSTRLSGSLSCELPPSLKVLDLAYNRLQGSLPGCLLSQLGELYVPGNALSGRLPAPAATSALTTLYANGQRGGGLSGSIPVSIGSLRRLQFLNLANNKLSGALPGLPASMKLLNISGNSVTGRLGSLPSGLWQLDVADNDLAGPLPGLAGLGGLETLVLNNNPRLGGSLPALPARLQHLEAVGCGLAGSLPSLSRGMTRLDVSDNALGGSLAGLDATHMEVLRASNNSFSGVLPASAGTSPRLFLLDLARNKLGGSLPAAWSGPRLQMVMLQDNELTGTIPAALASLPLLGVLRLGGNKLTGSLSAFAAALNDPAAVAAAKAQAPAGSSSSSTKPGLSRLFDLNVTSNQLTGPVPDQLAYLGVFNPNITILVPGSDGAAAIAPRVVDLSGNALAGDWPRWLLKAVPGTVGTCGCSVAVDLGGPHMRLPCPPEGASIAVTDFMWQAAAEQRFACWAQGGAGTAAAAAAGGKAAAGHQAQLLDYLVSPSNNNGNAAEGEGMALGDGGGQIADNQAAAAKRKGVIAGAVVGVVVGGAALAALAYFVVYRRLLQPAKATAFRKFEDDAAAAAAAGPAASGAIDMQGLPSGATAAASGPAVSAAEAAARPL